MLSHISLIFKMSKVSLAIALVTEALAALCQCDVRSWLPHCVVLLFNTLCYIHLYLYEMLHLVLPIEYALLCVLN